MIRARRGAEQLRVKLYRESEYSRYIATGGVCRRLERAGATYWGRPAAAGGCTTEGVRHHHAGLHIGVDARRSHLRSWTLLGRRAPHADGAAPAEQRRVDRGGLRRRGRGDLELRRSSRGAGRRAHLAAAPAVAAPAARAHRYALHQWRPDAAARGPFAWQPAFAGRGTSPDCPRRAPICRDARPERRLPRRGSLLGAWCRLPRGRLRRVPRLLVALRAARPGHCRDVGDRARLRPLWRQARPAPAGVAHPRGVGRGATGRGLGRCHVGRAGKRRSAGRRARDA